MADHDYIDRVRKQLTDIFNVKFVALFNTPKDQSYAVAQAELVGFMRAINKFNEILIYEANPPPPQPAVEEGVQADV